ncbi:MAG: cytochrome c biogenesis protein CcsA [Bacteroidales bacterium]|jgi:cytochrome c-type biogenesis protein CcsB|nr:cytochrome c biogenesis protein CcsA [Bacteroidales bacterium]
MEYVFMFTVFLIISTFCWLLASFFSMKKKENRALFFQTLGVILFAVFIAWLWIALQRPPFKTMGETRIWYSFFLALMGGVTYWRWKMGLLITFTNLLASVFVIITICKPEIQSQVLMPALQSVWFIPHVAVYMFGYAAIGCAFVLGIVDILTAKNAKGLRKGHNGLNGVHCFFALFAKNLCASALNKEHELSKNTNQLIKIGAAALGIGLCLGALWAKKAWGQYWSWDIKETAALITWAIFLLYLHLQKLTKINRKILWIILMIGFLSLNFTWFGVNYLPAAKKSPHTFYSAED